MTCGSTSSTGNVGKSIHTKIACTYFAFQFEHFPKCMTNGGKILMLAFHSTSITASGCSGVPCGQKHHMNQRPKRICTATADDV